MQIGDQVRLIGIPANLTDDEKFHTLTLFQKCLSKIFVVKGLQEVDGLPYPLIQLDAGHIVGTADCMETIYVEPEYLEPLPSRG
jgi:hypothetical protein